MNGQGWHPKFIEAPSATAQVSCLVKELFEE